MSWLVFDLHGSVVALCPSGSSSLSDAYRFDGFGVQIAAYPTSGAATNPFRYRGLLNIGADDVLGALLDMGARDYSPGLGSFTQFDSVQGSAANPLTMNRFLYALANPATLIDPSGHMALREGGGEGGGNNNCTVAACAPGATATSTTGTPVTSGSSDSWSGDPSAGNTDPCLLHPAACAADAPRAPDPREFNGHCLVTSAGSGLTQAPYCLAVYQYSDPRTANPIVKGFLDGALFGFASGTVLALVCTAVTGGVCGVIIVATAVVGVGATCADHGCGVYGSEWHVGGERPWTPYDIASLAGGVVGGPTGARFGNMFRVPVPQAAGRIVDSFDIAGQAPPEYVSKPFYNDGRGGTRTLPSTGVDGEPILYVESDIHPLTTGVSRGAERVVIGTDGSAWYTPDHYQSWIPIR